MIGHGSANIDAEYGSVVLVERVWRSLKTELQTSSA